MGNTELSLTERLVQSDVVETENGVIQMENWWIKHWWGCSKTRFIEPTSLTVLEIKVYFHLQQDVYFIYQTLYKDDQGNIFKTVLMRMLFIWQIKLLIQKQRGLPNNIKGLTWYKTITIIFGFKSREASWLFP